MVIWCVLHFCLSTCVNISIRTRTGFSPGLKIRCSRGQKYVPHTLGIDVNLLSRTSYGVLCTYTIQDGYSQLHSSRSSYSLCLYSHSSSVLLCDETFWAPHWDHPLLGTSHVDYPALLRVWLSIYHRTRHTSFDFLLNL